MNAGQFVSSGCNKHPADNAALQQGASHDLASDRSSCLPIIIPAHHHPALHNTSSRVVKAVPDAFASSQRQRPSAHHHLAQKMSTGSTCSNTCSPLMPWDVVSGSGHANAMQQALAIPATGAAGAADGNRTARAGLAGQVDQQQHHPVAHYKQQDHSSSKENDTIPDSHEHHAKPVQTKGPAAAAQPEQVVMVAYAASATHGVAAACSATKPSKRKPLQQLSTNHNQLPAIIIKGMNSTDLPTSPFKVPGNCSNLTTVKHTYPQPPRSTRQPTLQDHLSAPPAATLDVPQAANRPSACTCTAQDSCSGGGPAAANTSTEAPQGPTIPSGQEPQRCADGLGREEQQQQQHSHSSGVAEPSSSSHPILCKVYRRLDFEPAAGRTCSTAISSSSSSTAARTGLDIPDTTQPPTAALNTTNFTIRSSRCLNDSSSGHAASSAPRCKDPGPPCCKNSISSSACQASGSVAALQQQQLLHEQEPRQELPPAAGALPLYAVGALQQLHQHSNAATRSGQAFGKAYRRLEFGPTTHHSPCRPSSSSAGSHPLAANAGAALAAQVSRAAALQLVQSEHVVSKLMQQQQRRRHVAALQGATVAPTAMLVHSQQDSHIAFVHRGLPSTAAACRNRSERQVSTAAQHSADARTATIVTLAIHSRTTGSGSSSMFQPLTTRMQRQQQLATGAVLTGVAATATVAGWPPESCTQVGAVNSQACIDSACQALAGSSAAVSAAQREDLGASACRGDSTAGPVNNKGTNGSGSECRRIADEAARFEQLVQQVKAAYGPCYAESAPAAVQAPASAAAATASPMVAQHHGGAAAAAFEAFMNRSRQRPAEAALTSASAAALPAAATYHAYAAHTAAPACLSNRSPATSVGRTACTGPIHLAGVPISIHNRQAVAAGRQGLQEAARNRQLTTASTVGFGHSAMAAKQPPMRLQGGSSPQKQVCNAHILPASASHAACWPHAATADHGSASDPITSSHSSSHGKPTEGLKAVDNSMGLNCRPAQGTQHISESACVQHLQQQQRRRRLQQLQLQQQRHMRSGFKPAGSILDSFTTQKNTGTRSGSTSTAGSVSTASSRSHQSGPSSQCTRVAAVASSAVAACSLSMHASTSRGTNTAATPAPTPNSAPNSSTPAPQVGPRGHTMPLFLQQHSAAVAAAAAATRRQQREALVQTGSIVCAKQQQLPLAAAAADSCESRVGHYQRVSVHKAVHPACAAAVTAAAASDAARPNPAVSTGAAGSSSKAMMHEQQQRRRQQLREPTQQQTGRQAAPETHSCGDGSGPVAAVASGNHGGAAGDVCSTHAFANVQHSQEGTGDKGATMQQQINRHQCITTSTTSSSASSGISSRCSSNSFLAASSASNFSPSASSSGGSDSGGSDTAASQVQHPPPKVSPFVGLANDDCDYVRQAVDQLHGEMGHKDFIFVRRMRLLTENPQAGGKSKAIKRLFGVSTASSAGGAVSDLYGVS